MSEDDLAKKNAKLVKKLVLIAVLMFGFGYALVPLYDVLCKLVGQGQVLKAASSELAVQDRIPTEAAKSGLAVQDQVQTEVTKPEYAVDESRELTVEFVTTLNKSTPMTFRAETSMLKVHPGKYYTVNFYARNNSNTQLKAQAIPNIVPGLAMEFFKKIQCFCFTTQTFQAKEEKTMPVRFVVDPKIPESYKTITLSYTFFDITNNVEN